MKELSTTKIKILRTGLLLLIIALIIGILYFCLKSFLPGLLDILQHGDSDEIREYINEFTNTEGLLMVFTIQFLQIISIVFPGTPIHIASGAVFGTVIGFAICHYGYVLANMLVFTLSRRFGKQLDKFLPLNRKADKYDILMRVKNPKIMVMAACVLPIMPNGVIPYIASKTRITHSEYFFSVYFGSFITILVLNTLGNNLFDGIVDGDYTIAIVIGIIILLLLTMFFIFKKKIISWFNIESADKTEEK